jgi:hypothetical protein
MKSNKVKVVVFVPEENADIIREVIGNAGAGKIGKYSFCSFSIKGVGRFIPKSGSNPYIGNIGKLESVQEERIEFVCDRDILEEVILKIKENHPYDEVAMDVSPLEDF